MLHEPEQTELALLPTFDGALAKWHDAMLALDVVAASTRGKSANLPAIRVQAKSGPVLDHWLSLFAEAIAPTNLHKVPVSIGMEGLLGGLDLSATLASGKRQSSQGLLAKANGGVLVLHACEDLDRDVLSTLLQAFEDGFIQLERDGIRERHETGFGMLVIDSNEADEDLMPEQVLDRLRMHISLDGIDLRCITSETGQLTKTVKTQQEAALCGPKEIEAIVALSAAFGLSSIRPAMQALEVACLHAGIHQRLQVEQDDIEAAIRLSLLNRAKSMPSSEEEFHEEEFEEPEAPDEPEAADQETDDQEPPEPPDQEEADLPEGGMPDEIDVEMLLANLPPDLLNQLRETQLRRTRARSSGRTGARKYSFKRGRRVASIKGSPGNGKRLDLIATLRTAAPWQKARKRFADEMNAGKVETKRAVAIRPEDFQIRRFQSKSESTTIFAVDASGSTALNRLGEAKGAIEILLNESYSRRDHVALVAMRGAASEVLLPPSRSLIMAKRSLSQLAGGGGTPLAHGLQTALAIADDEQRRGRSVSIVVLTDGSANIAMDGSPGRAQAHEDAIASAKAIGAAGHACLFIDVSKLPGTQAPQLAEAAFGTCLPMPFASSHNISNAVLEHRQSG